MWMTPTKLCDSKRFSSGDPVTNGPSPCAVNQMASPAIATLPVVAPGWRNRMETVVGLTSFQDRLQQRIRQAGFQKHDDVPGNPRPVDAFFVRAGG